MTQPLPPQDNTSEVLATAALTLALIALENQVREDTEQAIQDAATVIAAAAAVAAATAPLTGIALISMVAFHTILTDTLAETRSRLHDIIGSGYQAATQLTLTQLRQQLGTTNVPATVPDLGTTVRTLFRDIDTMIGHAQTDIQNRITAAYDNADTPSTRILAVDHATTDATGALANRASKTATTTVQRATTDTQLAVYSDYQQNTGMHGLMKRWRTTSNDPCGMCRALNGTLVGINGDFDARATTDDRDLRPIWRDLSGPPRHPNCRCRLELVRT